MQAGATALAAAGLALALACPWPGLRAQQDGTDAPSETGTITAQPVAPESDGEGDASRRRPSGGAPRGSAPRGDAPRAVPVAPSDRASPRGPATMTPSPGATGALQPSSTPISSTRKPSSTPISSTRRPIRESVPASPQPSRPSTPSIPRSGPARPVSSSGGASGEIRPGTTVSGEQTRARVVEEERPERVPVYPDDPESAWWEINPSFAFSRAQREMKPLMLLFTGTWNSRAMALSEEVFATKSFNEYVKENLVICYLEYPRSVTDAPDSLRHIKEKFKVHGYPSVLIFNPAGEVEREIRGYHPGRPVDYFNELQVACRPLLDSIEARRDGLIERGYRTWSDGTGKEVFAEFVEHDGRHVVLRDAAGQEWTASVEELSSRDRKMVESFPPAQELIVEPEEESGE